VRTRRLDDLVRHWRRLLLTAEAEGVSSASLRQSLDRLDEAIASESMSEMKLQLAEVRVAGRALEEALRGR
jgi:hypothetical protein